jgi:cell wall-associated NlpC family hydrolase
VHELYERAGLPYTYAQSRDLYDGVSEFRRVFNPEPGDLIVWRGHVGIVTDAYEHLFFSALRSGVKVASYDSRYWKRRGRPRFFRYTILDGSGGLALESKEKTVLGHANSRAK